MINNKYVISALDTYLKSDICKMRELSKKVDSIAGMPINKATCAYIDSLEKEIAYTIESIGINNSHDDFFISLIKCREYKKQTNIG